MNISLDLVVPFLFLFHFSSFFFSSFARHPIALFFTQDQGWPDRIGPCGVCVCVYTQFHIFGSNRCIYERNDEDMNERKIVHHTTKSSFPICVCSVCMALSSSNICTRARFKTDSKYTYHTRMRLDLSLFVVEQKERGSPKKRRKKHKTHGYKKHIVCVFLNKTKKELHVNSLKRPIMYRHFSRSA